LFYFSNHIGLSANCEDVTQDQNKVTHTPRQDKQMPNMIWQGENDPMVPFNHGKWLAKTIPQVDVHLSAEDGYLTVWINRVPEVHAWLGSHFIKQFALAFNNGKVKKLASPQFSPAIAVLVSIHFSRD
jgi:pimeloyl-ACP methyl ester carboxylesterase